MPGDGTIGQAQIWDGSPSLHTGLSCHCYHHEPVQTQDNRWGKLLFLVVMLYFVVLLVLKSVKLNTQIRLEKIYPRKRSQYPASDEVFDLAAIVACLGVLVTFMFLDLLLG